MNIAALEPADAIENGRSACSFGLHNSKGFQELQK